MERKKPELFKKNEKEKICRADRRVFIEVAGAAAAAALTVSPLSRALAADNADFARSSCGEKKDEVTRALVTYASKYGTTGEVAEAIGKKLCAAGAACDVLPSDEVKDLAPYKAVIVGGAARNFGWMPGAVDFIKKNQSALSRTRVAYFMTCLQIVPEQPAIGKPGTLPPKNESKEERRSRVMEYFDPVLKKYPEVKPADMTLFAGAIDFDKLSRSDKTMMKSLRFVEGDWRDWEAIGKWGEEMASKLLST